MVLQQFLDFIETEDVQLKLLLKSKLVRSISTTKLDLDEENEERIKKLIINTVQRYADTSDPALKLALQEHYKTLEKIIRYC